MGWKIEWKRKWKNKWAKILFKLSPLTFNFNRTLFSFFDLKSKKYKDFKRQFKIKKGIDGKLGTR
jgi:hypothetical protein